MKLNTQYMHSLWFDLSFAKPMTKQQAMDRLRARFPHTLVLGFVLSPNARAFDTEPWGTDAIQALDE